MHLKRSPRSLILFPGALGDFICFLPALNRIQQASTVDLFARVEFRDLVSSRVWLRSVDSYEIRRLFVHEGAAEERVRDFFTPYDSVYSWMGSGVADFAAQLMSVTQGRASLFPFRPLQGRVHQVDYYLRCVGGAPMVAEPRVSVQADAMHWCETYWQRYALSNQPVLALAPGSGAREKNWPVPWFEAVSQWWRHRIGGSVIVILGPAEEGREGYDSLCRNGLQARNLSLAKLAALLSRCNLYLGNDSGITHLAAAVEIPCVALFGPSDVFQWAPRGRNVLTFTRHEECSPCTGPTMKGCSHRRCLSAMEPVTVIRQLEQWSIVASLTRLGVGSNLKH